MSGQPTNALLRFLLSGGANTAITYVLYLALIRFLPYRIGYTIAFVSGIALSYLLSRFYVFRAGGGWRAVILFPLVYLAQYGVGLAVVSLWVETLGWHVALAPAAAILVTVPLTFLLSRRLFQSGQGTLGQ